MDFIQLNDKGGFTESDLEKAKANDEVFIHGIIHAMRVSKWGGFIVLRKPKGLLQLVINNSTSNILNQEGQKISISELSRETAVNVTGVVKDATVKEISVYYKTIEIAVSEMKVLSTPNTKNVLDIDSIYFDEESYLPFKLDNRHITLRNPKSVAIFKISAQIVKAFIDYLTANDFTQIYSPKIVSAGAEGGANIFDFEYFGKKAFLAQSPQFYKQIAVGAFEKVFEIAPVYRAEKHSTSRHLNEYISIDLEMGFIKDHTDVMLMEIQVLRHVLDHLDKNSRHELNLLKATLPKLPERIPSYTLEEVHEVLHKHYSDKLSQDHRGEPDLAPEEEVFICDYALKEYDSDFVFVTHFPRKHRAFYSYDDPQNPELTLSFDLLMKGREITSGSQRMHTQQQYLTKMADLKMNPANFSFYLETFLNGMPPHGGLAIGLERLTAGILNIHNVKEASLFPRDINRIVP